jgi:hypothetical protein
MTKVFADGGKIHDRLIHAFLFVHLRYLGFIPVSGEALGELAVRVVNFEIIADCDGDAVGEDHNVDAPEVFSGGIFNPGDTTGIVGELPDPLGGRMRQDRPSAGHLLGSGAECGQGGGGGQVQKVVHDAVHAYDDPRRRANRHRTGGQEN